MADSKLERFIDAYIECALWSSSNETDESGGVPLDRSEAWSDWSEQAFVEMREDCADFFNANHQLIDAVCTPEQAGHDFWLTRNRHGAGFWDRGYPEDISDRLTANAQAYGECSLYVGDDRLLYIA